MVNRAVRTPFRVLQRLGLNLPLRLTQHLVYYGPFLIRLDGGAEFRMWSGGHKVENNLYWHGIQGHESASLSEWLRLARSSHTILDIGANTGLYALAAAAVAPSNARVVAFEPVSRIAELCSRNAALNVDCPIEVRTCAVGESEGMATLYDPGGDNAYSASLSSEFLPGRERVAYEVPIVSIDGLLEAGELGGVDLVKLDVEGCEAAALRGMRGVLSECRPRLVVEYPEGNQDLTAEMSELMTAGYSMYWLTEAGRVHKETPEVPPPASANVLLCHEAPRS